MGEQILVVIPTAALGAGLDGLLSDLRREISRAPVDRVIVRVADAVAVYDLTPELTGRGERVTRGWPSPDNGPAINRNRGADGADAPWLVFLDDDVRLPPGWLDRLEQVLDHPDAADLIGGGIGSQQPGNWFSQAAEDFVVRHREYPEGWYLAAAHLAVRHTAFAALGGFRVDFDYGAEDWDLCRRAHHAGLRVDVTDAVWVAHANATSWGQLATKAHQYGRANARFDQATAVRHGRRVDPPNRTKQTAADSPRTSHSGSLPVRALKWVTTEYRTLRKQGRGPVRAARSTALYVPWMATYLRALRVASATMGETPGS